MSIQDEYFTHAHTDELSHKDAKIAYLREEIDRLRAERLAFAEESEAYQARLRMALRMIKGWKDSTLLADPDEPYEIQKAYERGANKAFNECAGIAEKVLE